MRSLKLAGLVVFGLSAPACAEQNQMTKPLHTPVPKIRLAQYTHWEGIGCVHSNDECYHLAQDRGYPHYRIVHSHQCHTSMLCQGGHH